MAFGQIDGRVEAVEWNSTRIASIEGTYRVYQIPPYMFADCPPVITHVTWPERLTLFFYNPSAVIAPETRKLTAYHEGGHALVALLTPGARPIHKATITPRGSSLGMVMQLPEKDELNLTKKQLLAMLT